MTPPPARTGLYPGTFDPPTLGHLDVLERGCAVLTRVIVAIGIHPGKTPLLHANARAALWRYEIAARRLAADVTTFDGLVTDHAETVGAVCILRGVRGATDLDYEMQMAGMNGTLLSRVQTLFLPARPALAHIAGTQVRQIARMGGDISPFVSPTVAEALRAAVAAET